MSPGATGHVDTFVHDRLPPPELRPVIDLTGVPELEYPERLNAAEPLLDRWVEEGEGDRVVFHHAGGPWTYRRLFKTANRIARVLVDDCGIVPGNRVLLRGANSPMLVACWYAVLKTGGIAVTTMPLLRERELRDIIDQTDVRIALTDAPVAEDLEAAMAGLGGSCVVRYNGGGPRDLEARMTEKPDAFDNVPTAAENPAIIAFTSGTTGRGKGTVHTHRDLLAVTDTYGRHVLQPQSDDIFIGTPPIAFTYALGGLVLFPMRFGASAALVEQMTPPMLLELIPTFRATITFTSPTAYRAMLAQAPSFDLTSLRKCVSAGETLPAATFEAWRERTGISLMDGIGSTEMLHVFIGCRADEARAGYTGKVVPGYRAMVVDDQGREVARGEVGRLAVQGPTGCRYLDDLDNQRKYVQRGWNMTGDAFRQDEDGYFHYEARTDDMIISSGYNISGVEVENVLLAHAAVAECAVVGVPDEARGRIVKAFVVPAAGTAAADTLARELQDFVKSQLAPYKYPRAIEFVRELPRTLTGKLQRFRLRDPAWKAPVAPVEEAPVALAKVAPVVPVDEPPMAPAAEPPVASMEEPPVAPADEAKRRSRPPARRQPRARTEPPAAPADEATRTLACHDPEGWPKPAGYTNAVSGTGRMVFVAGQVGWDPKTQVVVEGGFAAEVRQALMNVAAALDAAGARPDQIARLTWYITDRDAYLKARKQIGKDYREIIGRHFPAMSVVVVASLIEPGAHVEIEATCIVPNYS